MNIETILKALGVGNPSSTQRLIINTIRKQGVFYAQTFADFDDCAELERRGILRRGNPLTAGGHIPYYLQEGQL